MLRQLRVEVIRSYEGFGPPVAPVGTADPLAVLWGACCAAFTMICFSSAFTCETSWAAFGKSVAMASAIIPRSRIWPARASSCALT